MLACTAFGFLCLGFPMFFAAMECLSYSTVSRMSSEDEYDCPVGITSNLVWGPSLEQNDLVVSFLSGE